MFTAASRGRPLLDGCYRFPFVGRSYIPRNYARTSSQSLTAETDTEIHGFLISTALPIRTPSLGSRPPSLLAALSTCLVRVPCCCRSCCSRCVCKLTSSPPKRYVNTRKSNNHTKHRNDTTSVARSVRMDHTGCAQ